LDEVGILVKENIDLSNDLMAIQRLKETAEKTKIELSTAMASEIHLPFLTADATGPSTSKLQSQG